MPVIIDGYNFIGQCSFTSLSDKDKEEKLIAKISYFQSLAKKKTTIVFDGKNSDIFTNTNQTRDKLSIRYAPSNKSADDLIKEMIKKDGNAKKLTIVTADNDIRLFAKHHKCKLQTPAEFERKMRNSQTSQEIEDEKPEAKISKDEIDNWLKEFSS